jgi:putative membrane protein
MVLIFYGRVRNLLFLFLFRIHGDQLNKNNLKYRELFVLFLKGIGMGAADIIPGVSGGTIALITGIYENLIGAIKSIDLRFILYFFMGLFDRTYFTKSKDTFLKIKFKFLISLALGIGVAFLVLANILGWLLDQYTTYTYSFFFGLILSSAFFVYKTSRIPFNVKTLFSSGIGIVFGVFIVGLETIQTDHSFIIVFIAGIVTFCAMILPGLSGAFILLALGQYDFLLNVLRGITHLDFSSIWFVVVYIFGGIIGLIGFSRVLSSLLKNRRGVTLSFIIGLMIGALRKPAEMISQSPENMGFVVIVGLIGVMLVSIIGYYDIHSIKENQ